MNNLIEDIKLMEQFTMDTGIKISIDDFNRRLRASVGLKPIKIGSRLFYTGIRFKDNRSIA